MRRTPARVAAKIDGLSRAAHRFHRFAHHPLCEEYAGEVVRLGRRTRVCRGCVSVALGSFTGFLAAVLFVAAPALLLAAAALGLGGLGAAVTRASPSRARTPKLVSRFFPAAATTYALGCAVQLGTKGVAFAAAGAVGLFCVVALYRRRGPNRSPCASCPERNLPRPCRGIAPIVQRERAFRRLAGQWLQRAGFS
jgi:hypothetical protein